MVPVEAGRGPGPPGPRGPRTGGSCSGPRAPSRLRRRDCAGAARASRRPWRRTGGPPRPRPPFGGAVGDALAGRTPHGAATPPRPSYVSGRARSVESGRGARRRRRRRRPYGTRPRRRRRGRGRRPGGAARRVPGSARGRARARRRRGGHDPARRRRSRSRSRGRPRRRSTPAAARPPRPPSTRSSTSRSRSAPPPARSSSPCRGRRIRPGSGWLLEPILRGEADLVAPSYARGRFEGVLVSGLVYPLTRALFGHRILQPLGRELAMSRRLAEHLSRDDEWRTDPAHAGADLWVITKALVRECRCAQVFLGPRPVPQPQPPDVSDALAAVLGTVFHEMALHAAHWQRVRGSCAVATFGDEHLPGDAAHPPAPGPLVAAFELGAQDLRRVWGAGAAAAGPLRAPAHPARAARGVPDARPPLGAGRLRLRGRLAREGDGSPAAPPLDDAALPRLGRLVRERGGARSTPPGPTERIERLCEAFEAEKPYLISRWRWPDRFAP